MRDHPLHSVSVAGVTLDEAGNVLLIKRRDNGEWQAPGGVLELHEGFEDGVRREVLEETGAHVEVQQLTGIYKNVTVSVVALVFRCRALTQISSQTSEASEVAWVSLDEALDRMQTVFAVRVRDAIQGGGAAIRIHDGENLF